MKTSRILCSLFVLGTFASNAFAASPLPGGKCYETHGGADYNMIIYFENDYPKRTDTHLSDIGGMFSSAAGGAEACYANMKSELVSNVINKITQDDEAIFLLASTDTLASADYNVALATRRAGFAMKALAEAGIPNDVLENQVKVFIGGESNAAAETSESGSNPTERAIRIVVKQANEYTPPVEYHEVNLTNNINITNNTITNTTNNSHNSLTAMTSINVNYDDSQLQAQQKRTEIGLIVSELGQMNNSFDRSHWKTASGNFNGARLASDSIAGVVLGTAGGLITSNIIKKNQIRSGFEDLQCVIAGQVVADYNDEFTTRINLQQ
ncbi:MAG: hypothetical protein K2M34_01915 [Alphaproteobacteria bacterium]|nr:hypothetical protein [Alphaproteobacteria bacterium]